MEEEKIKCQRCYKEVLKTESVKKVIIGRGRKNGKACLLKTEMTFCSGQCAAHEQMSMEG